MRGEAMKDVFVSRGVRVQADAVQRKMNAVQEPGKKDAVWRIVSARPCVLTQRPCRVFRLARAGRAFRYQLCRNRVLAVPNPARSRARRPLVFTRRNYVLMIAGVLAVVVGYALMAIENELYGFISLYIAPLIILGGYLEIIYAILWRPPEEREEPSPTA